MLATFAAVLLLSMPAKTLLQIGDPFSGYSSISADGKVVACRRLGEIDIWDTQSWTLKSKIELPAYQRTGGIDVHAAVSPDGSRVACLLADGGCAVYDSLKGRVITQTAGAKASSQPPFVASTLLKFSLDGKILFAPAPDADVKAYSDKGEALYSISASQIALTSRRIAALWDDRIDVIDQATGKLDRTVNGQFDADFPIAISSDGQFVAGTVFDYDEKNQRPGSALTVWDVPSGRRLWKKPGSWEGLKGGLLRFSADDRFLAAEGEAEDIVEMRTGKTLHHNEYGKSRRLIGAGESRLLLRQGPSDSITVSDLDTGGSKTVNKRFYESSKVFDISAVSKGPLLAVEEYYSSEGMQSEDSAGPGPDGWGTRIWNGSSNRAQCAIPLLQQGAYFPDEKRVYLTHLDGSNTMAQQVDSYAADSGKLLGTILHAALSKGTAYVQPVPDGSGYLALGSADGQVGSITYHPSDPSGAGMPLEKGYRVSPFFWPFSPNRKLYAAISYPKSAFPGPLSVDVWDLATGEAKHMDPLQGAKGISIGSIAFSPDSSCLLTSIVVEDQGRQVTRFSLWDVKTGKSRCQFESPNAYSFSAAVSPNNAQIAVGQPNGFAVYSTANGSLDRVYAAAAPSLRVLGYSHDGTAVFTTLADPSGPISKWQVSDGRFLGSWWGLTTGKRISQEWISVSGDGVYKSSSKVASLLPH